MEIEITSLLGEGMFSFSHSAYEGGENAGRNTWNAAKSAMAMEPLLSTPDQLEAVRDWMKESGGWNRQEREAMSDLELNALFLQIVAGDCREAGAASLDKMDWEEYQAMAERGNISGRLSRSDDGRVFIYLGC